MKTNIKRSSWFLGCLIGLFFSLININSQAQSCGTPSTPAVLHDHHFDDDYRGGLTTTVVRIWVHQVNMDDGTGGNSWTNIMNQVDQMAGDFQSHNICFVLVGRSEINNTAYFNINADDHPQIPNLTTTNLHEDAIDIYSLPQAVGGGWWGNAYAIPNHYLVLKGGVTGANGLTHEMGHDLGLYHTFETFFGNELVNGSNCTVAGDLVCDTGADDDGSVSAACAYTGGGTDANGQTYNPDTQNYMAYGRWSCHDQFTTGQRNRMHSNIQDPVKVDESNLLTCCVTINSGNNYRTSLDSMTATVGLFGGGNWDIGGTAYVTFTAGEKITLKTGFHANGETGGYFKGSIKEICNGSIYMEEPIPVEEIETEIPEAKIGAEEAIQFTAHPNPFSYKTQIDFTLPEAKELYVAIYDLSGNRVAVLADRIQYEKGNHVLEFKGEELVSGIYFCKLTAQDYNEVIKLMVVH